MVVKCAFCNSPELCAEGETPVAWTYRKCPECGGMNKFRPIDDWDRDGNKTTIIVSEMLASGSTTAGTIEPPRETFDVYKPRASDAELGRAISNIIKRKS